MVPALNAIGIDVACYGNHDFDFGEDQLEELANQTNFPWLISNADMKGTGRPLGNGHKTHLIEHGGRKIGFLGLIEYEWLVTLHSIEPEDVHFEDFCACARRLSKGLRQSGAELVVAMTHMRVPNDELLAREVPEVDVILGGHDHHYDVKPVGPHNTYVLKSGTDFRDVTVLRLRFLDGIASRGFEVVGHDHVAIESEIAEDEEMKVHVEACEALVGSAMDEVIGYCAVDLDARFASIRTMETSIGNFITDVMREQMKTDIAFINSGTLRADAVFDKGPFYMRDLVSLLPMLDELCILQLQGSNIIKMLENGVSQYPRLEGRFLQLSGLRFSFDALREPGSRVLHETVLVGGAPIELDRSYTLCTLNFLRQGKDGFDVLRTATCIADGEQTGILPTMVRDRFTTIGALDGTERLVSQERCRRAGKLLTKTAGYNEVPALVRLASDSVLPLSRGVSDSSAAPPSPMQHIAICPQVDGRCECLNPVS